MAAEGDAAALAAEEAAAKAGAAEETARLAAEAAAAARAAGDEDAAKAAEEAAARAAADAASAKAALEQRGGQGGRGRRRAQGGGGGSGQGGGGAAARRAAEEAELARRAAEEAEAARLAAEAAAAAQAARELGGAVTLQRIERGKIPRCVFNAVRALVSSVEEAARRELEEERARLEAARRLQADERRRKARLHYQLQQRSAIKLQAVGRRMGPQRAYWSYLRCVREVVEEEARAVVTRQFEKLSAAERKRLAKEDRAARRLQRQARHKRHVQAQTAIALRLQALWRGFQWRVICGTIEGLIVRLEDEEGEANARANAAIKVQRAFHEKQARRAALAHKKQMHALRYGRAVRTVQRAFRRMPERVVAKTLRALCASVVLLSVHDSAYKNAALRIQNHTRRMIERRKEERAALRRAREEERMSLLMGVALGRRDVTRAIPWSTYSRKAAHHSVTEDGGMALYGGPPRKVRDTRQMGGLTSVVPHAPRDLPSTAQLPSMGGALASHPHHHPLIFDGSAEVEALTELLPGGQNLLPSYALRPEPPAYPPAPFDRDAPWASPTHKGGGAAGARGRRLRSATRTPSRHVRRRGGASGRGGGRGHGAPPHHRQRRRRPAAPRRGERAVARAAAALHVRPLAAQHSGGRRRVGRRRRRRATGQHAVPRPPAPPEGGMVEQRRARAAPRMGHWWHAARHAAQASPRARRTAMVSTRSMGCSTRGRRTAPGRGVAARASSDSRRRSGSRRRITSCIATTALYSARGRRLQRSKTPWLHACHRLPVRAERWKVRGPSTRGASPRDSLEADRMFFSRGAACSPPDPLVVFGRQ